MNAVYTELAERIRGEVQDLDRTVQRAIAAWPQAKRKSAEDAYLDSVALNLHGFYSGIERLFELIVRRVDRTMPTGETWHRSLLDQVAQDVVDVRPAVISQNNALTLVEMPGKRINVEPESQQRAHLLDRLARPRRHAGRDPAHLSLDRCAGA